MFHLLCKFKFLKKKKQKPIFVTLTYQKKKKNRYINGLFGWRGEGGEMELAKNKLILR